MTSFKELAQQYIDKEISVTPVDSDKRPFGNGWQSRTGSQIFEPQYEWTWNKCNGLGILCGEPSGVVILDIDIVDDDENEDKIRIRKHLEEILPPVYLGRRGNRKKPVARLYKYNGELNEKFKMIDVEILSTGNQAVLPPSKHPTGVLYEWVNQELLNIEVEDLPDLDEEVLIWLRQENEKLKKQGKPEDFLRSRTGRCKSGSHNYLSSIGVAMRHSGATLDQTIIRLISVDTKINNSEDSLYFLCKTRKWKTQDANANALDFVNVIFKNHKVDPVHEKYKTLKDGFYVNIANADATPKWVPHYNGMSQYFKNEIKLKNDDSYLCFYNDNHYQSLSNTGLLNKIDTLGKGRPKPHELENFKKKIKAVSYYSKENFDTQTGFINVANGVLDVRSNKLMKHDPKYNFRYKLSHKFNPDAHCPTFTEFLNFIFQGDQSLIKLVGEIMGYTIIGGYPTAHRAFVFYGDGRNGKSTLLETIIQLLGERSVSAVSMDLISKPFSVIRMDGKLANIVEESPTNINAEAFKNITGGGMIAAAHKGMDEFDLKIYARMFFACNDFPRFKDGSVAIKDRLVILPFNRYITEEERDPTITKRIFAEMSGILNFAIDGYQRFKEHGFTKSEAVENTINEYLEESDSVRSWFSTNIDLNFDMAGAGITVKNMHTDYTEYCEDNGFKPVNNLNFGKRLKRIVDQKGEGQFSAKDLIKRVGANREQSYLCLNIRNKPMEINAKKRSNYKPIARHF